ncbi:uncharacterized protein Z520_00270 [Fonsecaea multimorphosa CBS 102226]|uniref:Sugar phosphate transporter domain-containing protein n=1 Tax=Fonsecaea multimorphosa CBS 102226 TaxID=1442371 RepID=A0A0D2L3E8_9EURO|nr:uncharacterized protein Z520_00270 [Fonsecaea multimorphosa CBS 102226]KIY03579.1 hypothetical protein Z520_00270 [Fonsecaea multimorphosa CBS 102226]OAL32281.1 hypothetical protein AYO22_00303 [Fonsecaea multimorphosa]
MPWTMLGTGVRSSILSIWLYFILNMLVTVTNKQIVSRTACPWLLTACHAFATFVTTGAILRLQKSRFTPTTTARFTSLSYDDDGDDDNNNESEQKHQEGDGASRPSLRTHLRILLPFSLLYTLNIALSNLALGLVTLTMHQTIRATAPVITVLISIAWLGRSWREYPVGVYGAITLTICGVIIASNAASSEAGGRSLVDPTARTTPFGFTITLLGAVLAVLKTIMTNELQRPPHASRWGLGLSSTRLVQYLALYAVNQTVLLASWTGEIKRLSSSNFGQGAPTPTLILKLGGGGDLLRISLLWPWLWLLNGLAVAMLNLASFEANKRCGPLSMAIAANMKQVLILVLVICFRDTSREGREGERQAENIVILGSLMTTIGGMWYAFASSVRVKERQRQRQWREAIEGNSSWTSDKRPRGWKG